MRSLFSTAVFLLALWMPASLVVGAAAGQQDAKGESQTPLTVSDVLRYESFGGLIKNSVSFSPDGRLIAYHVVRPPASARFYKSGPITRSDVWIADVETGATENITNGAPDGSGFFCPVWSPDGSMLLLLSTRGEEFRVRPWIWTRESKRLRKLSEHSINVFFSGPHDQAPVWISPREIVLTALDEHLVPYLFAGPTQTPTHLYESFKEVQRGERPTVHVLESGTPYPTDDLEMPERAGTLVLVDVGTGRSRTLSSGAPVVYGTAAAGADTKLIAYSVESLTPPTADETQPMLGLYQDALWRLRVFTREGERPLSDHPALRSVVRNSAAWSPDGSAISFVSGDRRGMPSAAWRYDLRTQRLSEIGAADVYPVAIKRYHAAPARADYQLRWLDAERLLFYGSDVPNQQLLSDYLASRLDYVSRSTARIDWWTLRPDEQPVRISRALPSGRSVLYRLGQPGALVAVAEGKLWRIDSTTTSTQEIFAELGPITGFLASSRSVFSGANEDALATVTSMVVSTRDPERGHAYYALSFETREARRVQLDEVLDGPVPVRPGDALVLGPTGRHLAIVDRKRDGQRLRLFDLQSGRAKVLHHLNAFLERRIEARSLSFDYESLRGQRLTGWLLLPAHHENSRRYPLVANIYAGRIVSAAKEPDDFHIAGEHVFQNAQLLAAQGYAVLIPSMPLEPIGERDDVYPRLTEGVLPAIDKVVEMGIADPDRIGVMGCSFGGYSTMGIVSQTIRFKAAIAMAGISEFTSVYGEFTNDRRYHRWPLEEVGRSADVETGQARIGAPPWLAAERVRLNSPLSHVANVQTPVMLIHTDLDEIHVQQAEQFFVGLYRQGKRAKLVRYFGDDGHCECQSPANNQDMFEQIVAWLREHLGQ